MNKNTIKNSKEKKSFIKPIIDAELFNYLEDYNSNFTDRINSCVKHKNRILIVLASLELVFILTIINSKNSILKNIYFYFDILFVICLTIYIITITILYHKKIRELDNLDNQNNQLFYNNFIKDKYNKQTQNKTRNNLVENVKNYTNKVNKQILIQNDALNYLNKCRKQTKQNLREGKSLANLFNTLKNKLKDLIKNGKTNKSKDNKEITILERILDRISKIVKNLVPKIKGGSEIGGVEAGVRATSDIPGTKGQNIGKTDEEIVKDSTLKEIISLEQTKAEVTKQELKQTNVQTEPTTISNNIQSIGQKKIEEEIKSNVLNALEKANRELININKNERETIERLSSSISSAVAESLAENYDISIKNKEEDRSLANLEEYREHEIDTEKSIAKTEQIPNSTKKQSEQLIGETNEEEMSIEDMFNMESPQKHEFISTKREKKAQSLNIAARSETKDSISDDSIKDANRDLSRRNQIKQNKSGFSIT